MLWKTARQQNSVLRAAQGTANRGLELCGGSSQTQRWFTTRVLMKTQRFALIWPRLVALATAAHLSSLLAEGQANAPSLREISFNRDIRPILSDNCYSCHGPDKNRRKGKLRLDVAQDAYTDHEGHIPIV